MEGGEEKRGRKKWNRKMREVDSEKVSCGKQEREKGEQEK